jgi:modulator of FtsH protease HflK
MDVNWQHPDNAATTAATSASQSAAGERRGWRRWIGAFNLNDPRWGRGDEPRNDNNGDGGNPQRPRGQGPNQGPPDLDELWRDLNRKLGGLLGNKGRGGGQGGGTGGGGAGGFSPNPKAAGIGVGLVAAVAALIWLGTGFFIVQEGQQAVITQFGRYHSTVGAGFNWRLPYPIQRHELVRHPDSFGGRGS